jgi:hypothetical protein
LRLVAALGRFVETAHAAMADNDRIDNAGFQIDMMLLRGRRLLRRGASAVRAPDGVAAEARETTCGRATGCNTEDRARSGQTAVAPRGGVAPRGEAQVDHEVGAGRRVEKQTTGAATPTEPSRRPDVGSS